ncbi:MAG: hypothetical protein J6A29_01835 [Clostridia bacterium]|nr:hypothetical protein [Clostridia bacterium]
MAENEGMEGKDLAAEEKKEFKEKVLEQVQKLKNSETKMVVGELEATKIGDQAILKVRGKSIAIVRGETIEYNLENFEELRKELAEEGQTLDDLGLPDLQEEIDKIQKQNSEQQEEKDKEEDEQTQGEGNDEELDEEEKDDEKPDLEDNDPIKEEIAKKYNVKVRDVVHFANDERVTEHERFQGLAAWSREYDDVYAIQGKDPYSYKFIGIRDGEQEEIEAGNNTVIGGKNPDITIKRIDGEKITEIKPLAMYEIDSNSAIAMVKNEYGEPEALYCRQEGGDEKTYWGSVIPEASGKNVLQQSPETRDFIDHKYNSGLDLADKADALTRQRTLEERGWPSKAPGVQINEIDKSDKQNREVNIEDAVEDLMKKDGIVDRLTVQPGYYENKAAKVLKLMEENETITYEQAVEQVENQGQREAGGRTPGQPRDKRGE